MDDMAAVPGAGAGDSQAFRLLIGEPAVAAVLEELERVLLEVAAGPDVLDPTALEALQRRIDERGLLFKVRVIQSKIRERERRRCGSSTSCALPTLRAAG
jgi:hypothetical protein